MAVVAIGAAACGGSSPTGPSLPPPPPTITFAADSANPGSEAIALVRASGTAQEVTLTLNASAITNLYGYGVDVVFNPDIVTLGEVEIGSYLDGDEITVTSQAVETAPGTLVVGHSRVGDVDGVTGSGVLLTLRFAAAAPGSTTIALENTGAFDNEGPIDVGFFGGTLTVPASAR